MFGKQRGWFNRARAQKTSSSTERNKPRSRRTGIMALEPRMMYDAAAAATVGAAAHHHHHEVGADHAHMLAAEKQLEQLPNVQTPTSTPSGTVASGSVSASNASETNTHRHHDAAATEPMPHVATWVKNPTEILFIDSQVPDYQSLVAGAKAGVEVVVLDPNSDGVAQIANFLGHHRDSNLATIDIVAHGTQGDVVLGSTNLTDADLANYSGGLAAIGATGAVIKLYGCDVAGGTAGMQFIADLSHAAGGADVVAATHDIGMTVNGPDWTLDAATGALVDGSPFSAAAMAGFTGQLGGETEVATSADTDIAAVTALPNGDYLVAWDQAGSSNGGAIQGRLYNGAGTALGSAFSLGPSGNFGFAIAGLPANAANSLPDGGFVLVYGGGQLTREIFDVTAAGAMTQVGSAFHFGGSAASPSVAVAADGSFAVAWTNFQNDFVQRFSATGAVLTGMIQVDTFQNTFGVSKGQEPSVAELSNGNFVVSFDSDDNSGLNSADITVFNSSGGVVKADTLIGDNTDSWNSVTGLTGGGFAVTWSQEGSGIVTQVFNSSGGSVTGVIGVDSSSFSLNNTSADPDGGFLVTWEGFNPGQNVLAQRFDASGNKIGSTFQIDNPAEPGASPGSSAFESPHATAVLTNGQVVAEFTSTVDNGSVWVDQFAMHSAPSGTDVTKTILENASYTLAAADFGFSDPLDGDSLTGVEVTTLPTSGSLKDNGVAVTAGQVVAVADITGGKLVFTPVTNSSGSPDSHFTFQVQDSGGNTTPNTNLDPTANTFTFNVTPIAPVIGAGDKSETGSVTEQAGVTGSTSTDQATGTIHFTDANTSDANTSSASLVSAVWSAGTVPTATQTALTSALATALSESNGSGTVNWTFSVADGKLDFLNAGQTLTATYHVVIDNHVGGTDTATVTITATGANDAAVISGTAAGTVVEAGGVNNATAGTPTASATLTDTDVDNPANTFTPVTTATASIGGYGSFKMTTGGTWTYTLDNTNSKVEALNSGDTLTDTFTVSTVDGTQKQITITIDGTNDAAVFSGTTTGTVVEAGGVNNGTTNTPTASATLTDTDVDNLANTFTAVTTATASNRGYGTFQMTADGTWTYTLDNGNAAVQALRTAGQTLSDSFTVHTADGTSQSISITIDGADDAPVAHDVAASATEAGGVNNGTAGVDPTGNVLTNDTDVDSVENGETMKVTTTGALAGTYGTLTLNADGSYGYAVDNSNTAVQALRTSAQTLTDTISYTIADAAGLTSTANVVVTIHGADDAPVAVDDLVSATEAGGVNNGTPGVDPTGNVLTNDTDVDSAANGETKTVTTTGALAGAYGTLTLSADGSYSYTVDNNNAAVQALRNDTQTLTDTIGYTMTDAAGLTSTANVIVTIHGADDAPVAHDDVVSATEAGGVNNGTPGVDPTGNVLTNDTDVDSIANGETKTVTTTGALVGAYGTLTLNADGSYTYAVDNGNTAVEALRTDAQTLTDTISYTMADAAGLTSTANVIVTIHGADDAPVAHDDVASATEAGGVNNGTPGFDPTGNVLTNDTDVDSVANGETKTVTTTGALAGAYGTLTLNADGSYRYALDNGNTAVEALRTSAQTLTDTIGYTMADAAGLTSTANVVVTIHGADDAPVAHDDVASATEAGGVNNGTPGVDPIGNVLSNDTDVDSTANGETQTVTTAGVIHGAHGTLTLNADGTYSYAVDNNDAAVQALRTPVQTLTDTFSYTMADAAGLTSSANLVVTIHGANDAPVAHDDVASATETGGVNNGTPGVDPTGNVLTNDTDVDSTANGETKTVTTTGALVGSYGTLTLNADGSYGYAVDNGNAAVQGLRTPAQTLTDTISYTMTDAAGLTSTANLVVTIHGADDAPVAHDDVASATEAGGINNGTPGVDPTGNLLTNDTDVDSTANGETMTVITTGALAGAHGTLTLNADGSYRYAVNNSDTVVQGLNVGQSLTDTISYTITDAAGLASTANLVVTIHGANDAPVIDAGNTVDFNANTQQPLAIDPAITLSDIDNGTMSGARIAIGSGFDPANDSLGFVGQHGIAGHYDSATGVMTLSGVASVADYRAAFASITFFSTTQADGTRTISWTVDDGGTPSSESAAVASTLNVTGFVIPAHLIADNGVTPPPSNVAPAEPVTGGGASFQFASSTAGDGFAASGGNGFHVVHTDPVLTTASDATVQIDLALAALEAPLGGDVAYITARQANGDPLPDWLKFDPSTGQFAGLPPDNAVASLASPQSDNDIVTGSLPTNPDLGNGPGNNPLGAPQTVTVEVLVTDSKGNVAVTTFTVDLRVHTAGKQGWNMLPRGAERHASLAGAAPELAAIEAAVRDATRPFERFVLRGLPTRHGDAVAIGHREAAPGGRAGLSEQLAGIGWRSMAAQRDALLASLQPSR